MNIVKYAVAVLVLTSASGIAQMEPPKPERNSVKEGKEQPKHERMGERKGMEARGDRMEMLLEQLSNNQKLMEETGITGRCGKFISTIENIFTDADGKKYHEIAVYYLYHPNNANGTEKVSSLEEHLEFVWADIDELEDFNIKPGILDDVLQKLSLNKKPDRFYSVKE